MRVSALLRATREQFSFTVSAPLQVTKKTSFLDYASQLESEEPAEFSKCLMVGPSVDTEQISAKDTDNTKEIYVDVGTTSYSRQDGFHQSFIVCI